VGDDVAADDLAQRFRRGQRRAEKILAGLQRRVALREQPEAGEARVADDAFAVEGWRGWRGRWRRARR
jgi:hypothetical protein